MTETLPADTVHVCIATGQNAANLIPLKQLNAQHVLILETPAMARRDSAKNLSVALKPYGVRVECLKFDDSSPQRIVESAAKLVEERLDGQSVVLHITGGTKLMVLALQDQLKMVEAGSGSFKMVYADTASQHLDWYSNEGAISRQSMTDVLTLQDQLLVQGYRTTSDTRTESGLERSQKRAKMTDKLAADAAKLKGSLGMLAKVANQAAEHNGRLEQQLDHLPHVLNGVLQFAQERELLEWNEADWIIKFADKESASYFAGGWLEEFVFLKMRGIFSSGQYSLGAEVRSNTKQVPNELDAVVVHRNRILLVECKTKQQNNDDTREALYKLSKLSNDLGGASATAIYVSAREVTEPQKQRAAEYGIKIFDGSDINSVANYLREWKGASASAKS